MTGQVRGTNLRFVAALALLGAGWGITQPLTKIAVSTGYQHFGLIFWQLLIGATLMAVIARLRGRGLPMTPAALKTYVIIALVGTILPNTSSYQAIVHLPSGVMSILLSLVPMLAFPMAVALRLERFRMTRLLGLLVGLAGVVLLAQPEASALTPAMLVWVPVALIAPFFYAFEGNYVGKWGTAGLDPIQLLFGASLVGAVLVLPMAMVSGQFISPLRSFAAPEWAMVANSLIHVLSYAGYVWLIRAAGPVFAAQIGYLVTSFGVLFAMLILGETYAPGIWAAFGLILLGVFLVQPRRGEVLAEPS